MPTTSLLTRYSDFRLFSEANQKATSTTKKLVPDLAFERWSVANRALLVPAPGNPGAWLAGSCGSSPALPARLELQVTAL